MVLSSNFWRILSTLKGKKREKRAFYSVKFFDCLPLVYCILYAREQSQLDLYFPHLSAFNARTLAIFFQKLRKKRVAFCRIIVFDHFGKAFF